MTMYLRSTRFIFPTVCFLIFLAACLIFLSTGERKYTNLPRMLSQWDGQHYLSIARDGYVKFPCERDPSLICGNAGWFPLYPIAARLVNLVTGIVGLDIRWAMIITSALSFWLALLVIFRLTATRYSEQTAKATILVLLIFPTSLYFLTAFPYALYLLLTATVFVLLDRERYLSAAVPVGLLAVTYPSGMVIGLPLLWLLITKWRVAETRTKASLLIAICAIGAAIGLYFSYYWWRFDDFLLYPHYQAKPYYDHHLTFPLIPIFNTIVHMDQMRPVFSPELIVVMLCFVTLVSTAFFTRKIPVTWYLFLIGVLLFTPTFGSTVSYYRHITVALPLFVMTGVAIESSRRRWLLPLYAVLSLYLMWFHYLPAFKHATLM